MCSDTCEVCKTRTYKYKCPSCRALYCSVQCWKDHQISGCQQQAPNAEEIGSGTDCTENVKHENLYETDDTVPLERLQLLENSEGLKQVLGNPHVRHMLLAIDNSSSPAAAMQAAMLEPIFVEFADRCLEVVEPRTDV